VARGCRRRLASLGKLLAAEVGAWEATTEDGGEREEGWRWFSCGEKFLGRGENEAGKV
jgi:hypothetical protein